MTSALRVLVREDGKSSPSFLAAIALLVLAVVGYFAWGILKPNPVGESEMIVRNLSSDIAQRVGPFRRAVRQVTRLRDPSAAEVEAARTRVRELVEDLTDEIEDLSDTATFDVEMLQGISLNTQENRLRRIRRLSLQARSRIGQIESEASIAIDDLEKAMEGNEQ